MDDKLCLLLPSLRVQRAPELEDASNFCSYYQKLLSLLPVSLRTGVKAPGPIRPKGPDGWTAPPNLWHNQCTATMRSDLQICIQLFFSPQLMKKGDLTVDVHPKIHLGNIQDHEHSISGTDIDVAGFGKK